MTIREFLKKNGMTAKQLSDLAGVSPSTISRHMAGKNTLSAASAMAICSASRGVCTLEDLLRPQLEKEVENEVE